MFAEGHHAHTSHATTPCMQVGKPPLASRHSVDGVGLAAGPTTRTRGSLGSLGATDAGAGGWHAVAAHAQHPRLAPGGCRPGCTTSCDVHPVWLTCHRMLLPALVCCGPRAHQPAPGPLGAHPTPAGSHAQRASALRPTHPQASGRQPCTARGRCRWLTGSGGPTAGTCGNRPPWASCPWAQVRCPSREGRSIIVLATLSSKSVLVLAVIVQVQGCVCALPTGTHVLPPTSAVW